MRSWIKTLSFACLATCLVALPSCNSDDDPGNGPSNATPEGRAVNTAMTALTTLTQVGAISRFVDVAGLPKPGLQGGCTALGSICSGGSVEFCSSQTGGFVNFTACNIGGLPVTGTINITSSQGNIGLSLDVGPYELGAEGSYFYHAEGERFHQTFDHVAVTAGNTSLATLFAADWDYLGVTDPTQALGPPDVVTFSGTYTDLTTSPPTVLFVNGNSVPEEEGPAPGDIWLRVYEGSFSNPLLFCDANLADGSASCDPAN